jgi:hypothetical protein
MPVGKMRNCSMFVMLMLKPDNGLKDIKTGNLC